MFGAPQGIKRPSGFDMGEWGGNGDDSNDGTGRKKKKRSRWNTEIDDKTVIPGMPTTIPPNLSKEQEKQYIVHLQIEEISRKLRSGDLGISPNPEDRSPSPEPIYNNEGKRLNTREYRTRKKLEDERHQLVVEAWKLNPNYKPPADYKPPIVRVSDKVMIPQEEHPDINFVGLLIGPRGNTLKNLEKETGAKIIIRGKGSVKEGKIGRKDGQPLPGEDEPLHAYVTANNPENVKKAVEKIKEIIRQGIEVPEGQNDLRRQQLRELALLNGTLRENDGLAKLKQIAQAQTIVTNTILCTVCGGAGHIAQDCKERKPGDSFRMTQVQTSTDRAKMDSEYMSLMAELGEGPPPKSTSAPTQQSHRPQLFHNQMPPNPMAFNPPWQQQQQQHHHHHHQQQQQHSTPRPLALQAPPSMVPPMSQQNRMPPSLPLPNPMASQGPPPMRPWQPPQLNTTTPSLLPNPSVPMGVPPPHNMQMSAPPPPPNSQAQPNMPWSLNSLQSTMAQAGMGQPGMQQPVMQQPGMQQPGMQQPGMQQPGMQQPGMQQPGMQQPGMQQPGMQQPGMQQPGMQQPGRATWWR
ncbi:splicing factor 1-like isoform X2 [Littorina saxatilis]|uniref:splicing factor 1-like isoform X2 n=1 Tax=Littorina saxatilis TaxID=31220 RepID=UPI0038B6578A